MKRRAEPELPARIAPLSRLVAVLAADCHVVENDLRGIRVALDRGEGHPRHPDELTEAQAAQLADAVDAVRDLAEAILERDLLRLWQRERGKTGGRG